MADISFAPGGGLKGFLGGYNFSNESENTLRNMLERRQAHDQRMKEEEFKLSLDQKMEAVAGDSKRQAAKNAADLVTDSAPYDLQQKKADASTAVSASKLNEIKATLATKMQRMDAVEQSYEYLRGQGGENGYIEPPSDIRGTRQQVDKILRENGWDANEVPQDPVSLLAWLEQGAQAAKVDRPRMEALEKHTRRMEEITASHPPKDSWQSDKPDVGITRLIEKSQGDFNNLSAADKIIFRGMVDQLALRARTSREAALAQLVQQGLMNPADMQKAMASFTKEGAFPEYTSFSGGTPAPTTVQPQASAPSPAPVSKEPTYSPAAKEAEVGDTVVGKKVVRVGKMGNVRVIQLSDGTILKASK
jgi:hypothetical protein